MERSQEDPLLPPPMGRQAIGSLAPVTDTADSTQNLGPEHQTDREFYKEFDFIDV